MTQAKRKRILELADSMKHASQRITIRKNMIRIIISESALDVIVEALTAYAGDDVSTVGDSK